MSSLDASGEHNARIVQVIGGIALLWLSWKLFSMLRLFKPRDQHSLRSVAILVLGDIGRSPRMMYHAQSFAENEFVTYVIGYGGSKPIPSLERLPKVKLRYLAEPPTSLSFLPFFIYAPIKVVHQVISILAELLVRLPTPPEYIVVQNPPSIPTLALVWIVGRVRGCKVIIDWHNLGYSILAMKLGNEHIFVRIAKWFEATFGQTAYAHLFVTYAMRDFLVKEWDLQGKKLVLHDRPPRHFHASSAQETHDLFRKLESTLLFNPTLTAFLPQWSTPYSTPFTDTTSASASASNPNSPKIALSVNPRAHPYASAGVPAIPLKEALYTDVHPPSLRGDRPALVVSSTSWTPDEDFGMLVEAMGRYEARARESHRKLPKMLVIVTGKGPLRDEYMRKIDKLQTEWEWVRCVSLWLEAEDYPILLGSADLGISLHSSSSNMDLPMKVVDMFGCGLPVCALGFECLHELVKDGENGLIFDNDEQLTEQLEALLTSFPDNSRLAALRSSLQRDTQRSTSPHSHVHSSQFEADGEEQGDSEWCSWDENWARVMRPLILRDLHR